MLTLASESFVIDGEDLRVITYSRPGEVVDFDDFKVTIVENRQIDARRWVSVHRVVWQENQYGEDHYFACTYEEGLTEYQEAEPPCLTDIRPVQRKVEIREVVTYV